MHMYEATKKKIQCLIMRNINLFGKKSFKNWQSENIPIWNVEKKYLLGKSDWNVT